jgi:serine/threonine protein phosphatase 1
VVLKGNHEEAMLTFLDDPSIGPKWVEHGGGPTLIAYGVSPPYAHAGQSEWERTSSELARALPDQHRNLLETLALSHVAGDYVFVHAGLRPGIALEDQDEQDLLWIRREFIRATSGFDKVVVHGHTAEPEVALLSHRIGVDTGAYATGVLSAVRLSGTDQLPIQARASVMA